MAPYTTVVTQRATTSYTTSPCYHQGGVNHYQDGLENPMEQGSSKMECLRTACADLGVILTSSSPVGGVEAGRDGMVHYGQLVPRGLYGWGGYGGSVFLWDPAREVGFAYIPTYLAWWDTRSLESVVSA